MIGKLIKEDNIGGEINNEFFYHKQQVKLSFNSSVEALPSTFLLYIIFLLSTLIHDVLAKGEKEEL